MNYFLLILGSSLAFMAGHATASDSSSAIGLGVAALANVAVGIFEIDN